MLALFAAQILVVLTSSRVGAEVFVVRDYHSGVTLSAGQWEASIDYLGMNETLDVFNVKQSRRKSVSSKVSSDGLGDLEGGRVMVSYGVTDQLMVSGGYQYQRFDVTFADLSIDTYDLDITRRHNFYGRPNTDTAYLFGTVGVRHHRSADFSTERIDDIDYLAGKISSRVRVSEESGRIVIRYGDITYSSPKVNPDGTHKPPLALGIENLNDTTLYLRSGVGRRWERFNIALLAEVGATTIHGQVVHNLKDYGVDEDSPLLRDINSDLDRSEQYVKAGIDLYYETLFGVAGHLSYIYQQIYRESRLSDYNRNHTLSAELIFRISRAFALTVGGEYYRNQYNGHIPLLYNRYTQSTFSRDYGVVKAGMTMVFGR